MKLRSYLLSFIVLTFSFTAHADVSNLWNSCDEQYRKAWKACNAKYNGKCSYLGADYKPSCKRGEPSLFDKWTDKSSEKENKKENKKQRIANRFPGVWIQNSQNWLGDAISGDLPIQFETLLKKKGLKSARACFGRASVRELSHVKTFLADGDTVVDLSDLVRCMKKYK